MGDMSTREEETQLGKHQNTNRLMMRLSYSKTMSLKHPVCMYSLRVVQQGFLSTLLLNLPFQMGEQGCVCCCNQELENV